MTTPETLKPDERMKNMSKYFGKNEDSFNVEHDDAQHEDYGKIGIGIFARAVQVWATQQRDEVTIEQAAKAFCCDKEMVEEAVEWHPWMFNINGKIEHDGY